MFTLLGCYHVVNGGSDVEPWDLMSQTSHLSKAQHFSRKTLIRKGKSERERPKMDRMSTFEFYLGGWTWSQIPVVPARGGAEVALKIYMRPFSSIELACAVRQPSPCVRALCESCVLLHMSHVKLHFALHTPHFTLDTALFALQPSHFTLHTSHCTLLAPHFTLYTEKYKVSCSGFLPTT